MFRTPILSTTTRSHLDRNGGIRFQDLYSSFFRQCVRQYVIKHLIKNAVEYTQNKISAEYQEERPTSNRYDSVSRETNQPTPMRTWIISTRREPWVFIQVSAALGAFTHPMTVPAHDV